nr:zinc finger, CCHC-type [Tanacetum cinerariifolium]
MDAAAMKHMASNFAKLDKFKGVDFRRWQKKMHFLLSSMSVVYVMTTLILHDGDDAIVEQIKKRAKWDNDDYAKYMAEDASSKKLLVGNFTNYKMTYSRPVMEQYNKLLGKLGRFTQHKMNMDEAILVSCIIEKLSPSWNDFKHTLKHLKEELTLVELGSHLHIEESLRVHDSDKPKGNNVAGPLVVNMVEHNNSSRYNDNKGKRKHHDNTRADPNKKSKVTCWKCGKLGHLKKDCKGGKVGNKANGSGINGLVDGSNNSLKGQNMFNKSFQFYYVTYVSEVYFVHDEDVAWVWGCRAVVRLLDPKLKALGERGIECIFVGYAEHSKAVRFYVIESNESVLINSIIESRDAIFDENRFSSVPRRSLSIPKGTEYIGGLVVLKVVTDEVDGTIEKFKARLVIQGFKQKSRIYYFDIYALVARISTIRLLIAMVSIHNLVIHQMDVKTTFLNGDLDKEAPKQWHQKYNEVILSNGYLLNQVDIYVYSKFDESSKGVIICLYVDDMLIFGTDQVLKKFNYFDCTPVSTFMDTSKKLMPNNGQVVSQLEYSRVIGCLMYAMTCTRPDIAFVVGKLSRYTSNPGTQHWQEIQRAFKKQTRITGSTIEYEFVALVAAGKEAEWLKTLLLKIPLWSKPIVPISIHCDNAATLTKGYS